MINRYHKPVEMNIIIPTVIDGNKDIFIPFNKQWEATIFKSGSKLNAPLIPMYVANFPSKAHKIPSKK